MPHLFRAPALMVVALAAAGCTGEANHLGNPLLWPVQIASTALENAVYQERRAGVEVYVKTHYEVLLAEIAAGQGPHLEAAMDLSGVPQADRPTRRLQMQADIGIYRESPEALVVALMVYGA